MLPTVSVSSNTARYLSNNCLQFLAATNSIMSVKRSSSTEQSAKKQKTSAHWSLGLVDAMKDPENVVYEDDSIITIKDRYPKAQFHYLVMPKKNISSLKSVAIKHKELLEHMEEVAQKIVNEDKHKDIKFNVGYHAEASMSRLHLHVISEDMNSECVKTKKHWNSFTTKFFLDSKGVHEQLETEGKITLPSSDICKKLLNTPLKCHKCDYVPKHMPDLKRHILSHFK